VTGERQDDYHNADQHGWPEKTEVSGRGRALTVQQVSIPKRRVSHNYRLALWLAESDKLRLVDSGRLPMSYYLVRFTYTCANGHWSTTERGYTSPDDGDALTRQFPQILPCSSCPPDTIVTSSSINVEFEISLKFRNRAAQARRAARTGSQLKTISELAFGLLAVKTYANQNMGKC
jgi:hypothetical protein